MFSVPSLWCSVVSDYIKILKDRAVQVLQQNGFLHASQDLTLSLTSRVLWTTLPECQLWCCTVLPHTREIIVIVIITITIIIIITLFRLLHCTPGYFSQFIAVNTVNQLYHKFNSVTFTTASVSTLNLLLLISYQHLSKNIMTNWY